MVPFMVFTPAGVPAFIDGYFWHGYPEQYVEPRTNSADRTAKVKFNRPSNGWLGIVTASG